MKKLVLVLFLLFANQANAYFYTTLEDDMRPLIDKIEKENKLTDPKAEEAVKRFEAYILVRRDASYKYIVKQCQEDLKTTCSKSGSYYENQVKCLSDNYEVLSSRCKFYIKEVFGPQSEYPAQIKVKKIDLSE